MASPALLVRVAAVALTDENTRKKMGWVIAAILSPIILIVAVLCSLGSGATEHNVSAVQVCFNGAPIPADVPAEYRAHLEKMRDALSRVDEAVTTINGKTEDGKSLDALRVKAIFYALYFGTADLDQPDAQTFADCFVSYEARTAEGGDPPAETAVPIEDMETVWQNIRAAMGVEATAEQKSNADNIYSLLRYGYVEGGGNGFESGDVPFIGADGFCSPIGAGWRSRVTSEFGGRIDPITGVRDGHTGMDLAVPTGTPVRAALPGTVITAKYHYSYGYYVMIDHGNGLSTLYAHNSQLLVRVGQTVQTGDVVSLSGSTGRSTGPHLHFEVRVNGQRTNPRSYLP